MQCALRCCDCCTHCRPCGTRGTKGFIGIPNFWLWWNPCSTDSGHLTSAFFKHIPNRLWGIFGSIFSRYFVSVPPKSKHSSLNDLILVLAPSIFCNFRQSYTIISWSRAWINLLIWVVPKPASGGWTKHQIYHKSGVNSILNKQTTSCLLKFLNLPSVLYCNIAGNVSIHSKAAFNSGYDATHSRESVLIWLWNFAKRVE